MQKIFIDTNIWIYATYTWSTWHLSVMQKLNDLQSQSWDFCISVQTLREYARVTTSKALLTPAQIVANLQFLRQNTQILSENTATIAQLEVLILSAGIKGKAIFDGNIVATMLHYGVDTILTHPQCSGL